MAFHGKNFIGGKLSALGAKTFRGYDPRVGKHLEPHFHQATDEEIDLALNLASDAAPILREQSAEAIANFLEEIARQIEALGDSLVEQVVLESGLGRDRVLGERGRTVNQLRMFAGLVREGSFVDARIDTAIPDRKPLPRPDLRRMLIPLGPVAVFGASNFPLAFSVAGGDTASAFAAKNPVVVKGHPAHPGTSELVATAITRAVQVCGFPGGTFSLLNAVDPEVSLAIARHPAIKAVGFTGSQRAGRAIFDAASQRPDPIPVYAEMGSINPVFVLPGALRERGENIAQGLTASINLGAGQFCTCPGLVIGVEDDSFKAFNKSLRLGFEKSSPATMLHPGILHSYQQSASRVAAERGLGSSSCTHAADDQKTEATPTIFESDASTFLRNESLAKEIFGPAAIVVRGNSKRELLEVANSLPGTLTATIHGTTEDLASYRELVQILETKAGRLIFNGYPTGVEVSPAMHHGGPYPAGSDSKFTSVGTAAILRFLRPICYQNFPESLLPPELQSKNPRKIWRTVNGSLTQDEA